MHAVTGFCSETLQAKPIEPVLGIKTLTNLDQDTLTLEVLLNLAINGNIKYGMLCLFD